MRQADKADFQIGCSCDRQLCLLYLVLCVFPKCAGGAAQDAAQGLVEQMQVRDADLDGDGTGRQAGINKQVAGTLDTTALEIAVDRAADFGPEQAAEVAVRKVGFSGQRGHRKRLAQSQLDGLQGLTNGGVEGSCGFGWLGTSRQMPEGVPQTYFGPAWTERKDFYSLFQHRIEAREVRPSVLHGWNSIRRMQGSGQCKMDRDVSADGLIELMLQLDVRRGEADIAGPNGELAAPDAHPAVITIQMQAPDIAQRVALYRNPTVAAQAHIQRDRLRVKRNWPGDCLPLHIKNIPQK